MSASGPTYALQTQITGAPAAPVITFLHAFCLDAHLWDGIPSSLVERHRCLRMDLPGHGGSSPLAAYSLTAIAERVVAVWDAAGVRSSAIVGCSLGGMVGMTIAQRWPERLWALVCANARLDSSEETRRAWLDRAATAVNNRESIRDEMLRRWFLPNFRAAHRDIVERVGDSILQLPTEVFAGYADIIGSVDLARDLASVTTRTLFVAGDGDAALSVDAVCSYARRVKKNNLAVFPDSAHLPMLDRPDLFWPTLGAFLG